MIKTIMRRKITERLLEWKRSDRRTCLVLNGARQVGKTYILREFGRENYDSPVYFDLSRDETSRRIFDGNLDADNLIMGLSTIVGDSELIPGRTLIFLDEMQDCPRARTSLKSFADDKGIVHYPLFAAAFMDCIDPPIPMEPDFDIVDKLNKMI